MPHLLPTTLAGSLPKPSWLAPPNTLWAPWKLEGEELAEGKRDAVRLVLRDQERAGIDIDIDVAVVDVIAAADIAAVAAIDITAARSVAATGSSAWAVAAAGTASRAIAAARVHRAGAWTST